MMKTSVSGRKAKIVPSYKKKHCSHVYACIIAVVAFCVPLCLLLKPEVIIKLY